MVNKFLEIKAAEDWVQSKIAAAKKQGEESVKQAENQEAVEINKMRDEIKLKRHQSIEQAQKEAASEVEEILRQSREEAGRLKVDMKLSESIARKFAQTLKNSQ